MANKIDYVEHQANFSKLRVLNPDLTVAKYCEEYGLKYGTAKKYIRSRLFPIDKKQKGKKKVKRSTEKWISLYSMFLSQCLKDPRLSVTQFAIDIAEPQRTVNDAFNKIKTLPQFNDLNEEVEMARAKIRQKKEKKSRIVGRSLKKLVGVNEKAKALLFDDEKAGLMDRKRKDGKFVSGHNADRKVLSSYVEAAGLNLEHAAIAKQIEMTDINNEIIAVRTLYLSMLDCLNRSAKILEIRYEDNDPIVDANNNPIPIESEMLRLYYSTSDKLRGIENSLANLVSVAARTSKELATTETILRENNALVSLNIILSKYQRAEEISAIATVKELEKSGIPVPDFLMFEAKKELSDFVPQIEDSGIDDDELDRIALEYKQKQEKVVNEWLPDRKEEIRKVFDEMDKKDAGLVDENISDAEIISNDQNDLDKAFDDIETFTDLEQQFNDSDEQSTSEHDNYDE